MRSRALLLVFVVLGVAAYLYLDGRRESEPAVPDTEAVEHADPQALQALRALGYGAPLGPEPTGPHRIFGVVRDRDGQPVAGIDVHAKMEANGFARVFRTVSTDANGVYSIAEVPEGRFWVGTESFVNLREPWALLTDVASDVEYDFTLAGGFRLDGWVEAPLGGDVTMRLARSSPQHGWTQKLEGSGRFSFAGLLPGEYTLRVSSARHGTIQREMVVGTSITGLTVDLRAAVRVSGRFEPLYPFDVAKVRYELSCEETGYDDAVWTVDLGFVWEALAPGLYDVRVHHQAFEDERESTHTFARRIDLSTSRSDLVLAIPPARSVRVGLVVGPERTGSKGEVILETPEGLLLASKTLRRVRGEGGAPRFERFYRELYWTGYTDFDRLEFEALPEGALRLRASLAGYADVERTLAAGGDVQVDLELQAIPGRMVEFDVPYEHLLVDVRREGFLDWEPWVEWDDRSKASHSYLIGSKSGFLPVGNYELRVLSARRVGPIVLPLVVEDSEETLILAPELEAGLAIRASLVDALGRPMRSRVYLLRREGLVWQLLSARSEQANVGPNEYEFRGLEPGAYRLALDPGGVTVLEDVILGERDLQVELTY